MPFRPRASCQVRGAFCTPTPFLPLYFKETKGGRVAGGQEGV